MLSPEQLQYRRGVYPAPTDWEGERVPSERLNALQNLGRSVGVLSEAWSDAGGAILHPLLARAPSCLASRLQDEPPAG